MSLSLFSEAVEVKSHRLRPDEYGGCLFVMTPPSAEYLHGAKSSCKCATSLIDVCAVSWSFVYVRERG